MDLPVMLAVGARPPQPATLVDLSEGGCLLRSGVQLPAGAQIAFAFFVSAGEAPCEATGVIVRMDGIKSNFGVQFRSISAELQEFVRMALSMEPSERTEIMRGIRQATISILPAPRDG
jgi:hypothetical protein